MYDHEVKYARFCGTSGQINDTVDMLNTLQIIGFEGGRQVNPVKAKILESLESVPEQFRPVRDHATRYLRYASLIDTDNSFKIGHQPWKAPYSFAITIYQPAKKSWFSSFKEKTNKSIPKGYQQLLLVTNGAFIHGLSLFGLPPSLQGQTPTLNRTMTECHDLSTANTLWQSQYKVDHSELLYFGSRQYSPDENIGYFINRKMRILSVRRNGEVLNEWADFTQFLRDEIQAAEDMMRVKTPEDWWS